VNAHSLRPDGGVPKTTGTALSTTVGVAALAAPTLHSLTDALEWYHGGFTTAQLWLNYAVFLPMPWLLLGVYAVHEPRPNVAGLVGALLYGAAFTYFAHTALYALTERATNYEELWVRLGATYTVHGAVMICGGLLFGWSVFRAGWLPRLAVVAFLAGVLANLIVWLLPAADILQTIGSAVRNLGLVLMGYFILTRRSSATA
jgi:hypothetical protein